MQRRRLVDDSRLVFVEVPHTICHLCRVRLYRAAQPHQLPHHAYTHTMHRETDGDVKT